MIRRLQRWLFFVTLPVLAMAEMFSPVLVWEEYDSGYLTLALLTLLLAASLPYLRPDRVTLAIGVFLYYTGIAAALASDYGNSFVGWHRLLIAFTMYPVAYYTIRTFADFVRFQRMVLAAAVIVVVAVGLSQIFLIGTGMYRTEIYLGGMGAYVAIFLGYVALAGPISTFVVRGVMARRLLLPVYALCIIVVVFSFRRSAMAGVALGSVALLIGSRGAVLSPVRALRWGMVTLVVSLLVLSAYSDAIQDLASRRGLSSLQGEMEARYGRVNETRVVWQAFLDGGPKHALFGTEFFNARELMGWGAKNRTIHVDYNVLLHGAGLVGLLLFVLVFAAIAARLYRAQRHLPPTRFARVLAGCTWAVLVANFVFSAGNQLWVTLPYALMFMYLGAMQRAADLLVAEHAAAAPVPARPVRRGAPLLRRPPAPRPGSVLDDAR